MLVSVWGRSSLLWKINSLVSISGIGKIKTKTYNNNRNHVLERKEKHFMCVFIHKSHQSLICVNVENRLSDLYCNESVEGALNGGLSKVQHLACELCGLGRHHHISCWEKTSFTTEPWPRFKCFWFHFKRAVVSSIYLLITYGVSVTCSSFKNESV